ncbi:hypothetical protein HMPREF9622_01689 [Cutibacterium modestum HL037PA3]|nr:hypothetical protein HMPREF9622_01689 [Cutibacterium modestum HL037PA3]
MLRAGSSYVADIVNVGAQVEIVDESGGSTVDKRVQAKRAY